jgi:hypothetical protein
MDKAKRRLELNQDLNEVSKGELSLMVEKLDKCWVDSFKTHGGAKITDFPDAIKAGEITINDSDEELIFPRLKPRWEKGLENTTSCYIITVDGTIVKIGALKDGVKSTSFSMYLTGVAGSPSRRSPVVYSFMLSMLRHGHKVEVYHVTMDGIANINIPTIGGFVNADIHYSHFDVEKQNLEVYKKATNGHIPLLNFKERNATVPEAFDAIYNLINKRISKNKKYTDVTKSETESLVTEEVKKGVVTEKVTVA